MEKLQVPQTSEIWWSSVKQDESKLLDWLAKQYHGEVTAAKRITDFASHYTEPDSREARLLNVIAGQETNHAQWVGDLLVNRGQEPVRLKKPERYWDKTLPEIGNFAIGAAVAAHAEHMRLERIIVIAHDATAPQDIRQVFDRILPQEVFHERAFSRMAGPDALEATRGAHERGRQAIGLFPEDAA